MQVTLDVMLAYHEAAKRKKGRTPRQDGQAIVLPHSRLDLTMTFVISRAHSRKASARVRVFAFFIDFAMMT